MYGIIFFKFLLYTLLVMLQIQIFEVEPEPNLFKS